MLLDVFRSNKTDATLPAWGGVVEDVDNFEFLLVDIMELFEIIPEKDIFLVNVGVDEGDSSTVEWVSESGTNDLDHRRNTSTSGDHAKVANEVGRVVEVAFGTLDTNTVTKFQEGNMLGDVALLVGLSE